MSASHVVSNILPVLGITITLIGLNLAVSFLTAWHIQRYYRKNQATDLAVYRLNIIKRYIGFPVLIISILYGTQFIVPYADKLDIAGKILVVVFPLALLWAVTIGKLFILHHTQQKIHPSDVPFKKQILAQTRGLVLISIPALIFAVFLIFPPQRMNGQLEFGHFTIPVIYTILLLIYIFILPQFRIKLLKVASMGTSVMYTRLQIFLQKQGIDNAQIFVWQTGKNPIANAMVIGYSRVLVFLTDHLLDNLSMEEIESILAHESGHIKNHDLWIRTGLALASSPIVFIAGLLLHKYAAGRSMYFDFFVIIILVVLYFNILFRYFTRLHETHADEYVLELGIDPKIYIAALYKLAKLNQAVMRFNKIDEKFQTHPSVAKRIQWVMEKANISDIEFTEIRIMADILMRS
ncbi:MAG: M48 family metalloprotease [Candidatus Saccharibacteria bacterium]